MHPDREFERVLHRVIITIDESRELLKKEGKISSQKEIVRESVFLNELSTCINNIESILGDSTIIGLGKQDRNGKDIERNGHDRRWQIHSIILDLKNKIDNFKDSKVIKIKLLKKYTNELFTLLMEILI